MEPSSEQIRKAIEQRMPEARRLLETLIAIPSLSGQETAAMNAAAEAFEPFAQVSRVALSDSLKLYTHYSDPMPGLAYDGRFNLRTALPGIGNGRTLLLNTHIDTVPPSPGQESPYSPVETNGAIYGRGACDAKGQIALLWLVMRIVADLGVETQGSLIGHIVVEEENGGNGTLAQIRHGESADGCIVLEPTDMRVLTSIRGAIWFRMLVKGVAGHSGEAGRTRSALKTAIEVIDALEHYHAALLARSRHEPLFEPYSNPMPLTIGKLHAGNWPATAPGEASLAGVLGFLPNMTASRVMEEVRQTIEAKIGPEAREICDLHFTYRHDASVIEVNHPLVTALVSSLRDIGISESPTAMTSSCDAWFYNNLLGIPTLVFGAGRLAVAHSDQEHLHLDDLSRAAEALTHMALRWLF